MSVQDPFSERKAEKYENPIPSREAILALIEKQPAPVGREALMSLLKLDGEEAAEALRRRLRAMERDGQLIFTRSRAYALPDKMNLVKGIVMGHKDGFGFLRPEEGGEDLFLVVILSVETLDDGAAVVGAELLGHGDLLNELSEKQACGDTADDSDSDVVVAVECLATVEHHSTFAVTVIVERVAEMT